MTRQELIMHIREKESFLCIGLDTYIEKIPKHLLENEDPVYEFNKQIIDATLDYCMAYKINTAFYESQGAKGWESMQKTLDYIPKECFTIADAKRGDIGNTSSLYARSFFEQMNFDSITTSPYMGKDSVLPFLEFNDKWVILLALTSNQGAFDFQLTKDENGIRLFEKVLHKSQTWGSKNNLMYVVGATRVEMFASIRKIVPNHFLLVPGLGKQGGNLKEIARYGLNKDIGLLVNSSRQIIYASQEENFAKVAGEISKDIQKEMADILRNSIIR